MELNAKYGLKIAHLTPGGIAQQVGIREDDIILAVNSEPLWDLISLELALASGQALLTIQSPEEIWELDLQLDPDETLGVTFQRAVSSVHLCQNNCSFCFVSQMPKGLRRDLYVRDDDWRLSFLQGNYITLTNLKAPDWERLLSLGTSPLYISIHTTNPRLRCQLMGNPRAGEIMEQLQTLAKAGISFHGQLVLVPGLTDGVELERSLGDLASLGSALNSLAVVPVGLTAFREGLPSVPAFGSDEALAVLAQVDLWQAKFRPGGLGIFYASDEFFLLAGQRIAPREYYDDFPQLENGVGMVRLFLDDLEAELEGLGAFSGKLDLQLATGKLALPILTQVAGQIEAATEGRVRLEVVAVDSFLGPTVTVAGLIGGRDLFVLPKDPRSLLIPDLMLNADGIFLDDLTPQQVQKQLGRRVCVVPATGRGLVEFLEKELRT